MRNESFVFVLVITGSLQYACVQPAAKAPPRIDARVNKPRFDQNVGATEEEIRVREGVPEYTKLLRAERLDDELRAPLTTLVKARGADAVVKELYFRSPNRVHIYWLVKENRNWRVISDAGFAPGVRF